MPTKDNPDVNVSQPEQQERQPKRRRYTRRKKGKYSELSSKRAYDDSSDESAPDPDAPDKNKKPDNFVVPAVIHRKDLAELEEKGWVSPTAEGNSRDYKRDGRYYWIGDTRIDVTRRSLSGKIVNVSEQSQISEATDATCPTTTTDN